MNKSDLIEAIASHANLTKVDAGRALDGITQSIQTALKEGDSVALVGFGTFEVKDRAERAGRKPAKLLRLPPQNCHPSKPVKA